MPSGIGGAGNIHRYDARNFTSGKDATGPAFAKVLPPSSLTSYNPAFTQVQPPRVRLVGRGGAGNSRPTHVYTPFDLEADLKLEEQKQEKRDERRRLSLAPTMTSATGRSSSVYRVGRGGAGNCFDEDEELERMRRQKSRNDSSSVFSDGSVTTQGSVRQAFSRRLSRMWSRE
jgi:FAD/FMN-containing dehydrogenase